MIWGEYDGALRQALVALKHANHDELAKPLGRRLAARVSIEEWSTNLTAVTAVPSHSVHRIRRGWAAADLLGSEVARALGLPFVRHLKRRGLGRQARRSRAQRLQLPVRAFAPHKKIPSADSRILLIDDVTTTGSTLRRAAGALLGAGAKTVHCAVLAYSPDSRRMS